MSSFSHVQLYQESELLVDMDSLERTSTPYSEESFPVEEDQYDVVEEIFYQSWKDGLENPHKLEVQMMNMNLNPPPALQLNSVMRYVQNPVIVQPYVPVILCWYYPLYNYCCCCFPLYQNNVPVPNTWV